MPITVRHDPAIAPLAAIAYAGGRGQGARERLVQDREHALRTRQLDQQQGQFNVSRSDRLAASAQQQRELDRSRKDARRADRLKRADSLLKRDDSIRESERKREHDLALEDVKAQNDYDQKILAQVLGEQDAEFKAMLDRGEIEYKYTEDQRRLAESYANKMNEVMNDPELRDWEQKNLLKQLQAGFLGIKPTPGLSRESEFQPGTGGIGELWQDHEGNWWTRDRYGIPQEAKKKPNLLPTMKDVMSVYDSVSSNLTTFDGDANPIPPDSKAVEAGVEKILALYQRVISSYEPEPESKIEEAARADEPPHYEPAPENPPTPGRVYAIKPKPIDGVKTLDISKLPPEQAEAAATEWTRASTRAEVLKNKVERLKTEIDAAKSPAERQKVVSQWTLVAAQYAEVLRYAKRVQQFAEQQGAGGR